MNPPTEALSAAGAVEAKANTASPRLRAAPRGSVAITATNSRTDRIPVQKLCIARRTRRLLSLPACRLAKAQRAKIEPAHSATVRSDTARTSTAAIGIPATSAMVAVQAIQEASSAEMEKPPPTSAIPRSTSCEEMVEPSVANAMTPIVSIATDSGGRAWRSSATQTPGETTVVCLEMKPVGEPYAGNPHVRFDERGVETERWPHGPKQPRPSSTLPLRSGLELLL